MRPINVTTDVYAAIWAARRPGEDSESAILTRILGVPAESRVAPRPQSASAGWSDPRFDVSLPDAFEIFRVYKGTEYRAKASGGRWVLSDGRGFASLNQLSRATSGNTENAWRNWYFMGKDGKRHLVEGLRKDIPNNVRHLA